MVTIRRMVPLPLMKYVVKTMKKSRRLGERRHELVILEKMTNGKGKIVRNGPLILEQN